MKLILKLAWRNIWRNKRRSILTLLAVTFATFLSVAMRGIQIGTYNVNIKYAVEMFTGYLQIQRVGYQKNPSLNLSFKADKKIKDALESIDEIESYAPRVTAAGLISFKDNSYGTALIGIDPVREAETSDIMDRLKSGKFFTSDTSYEVVLGKTLLENLQAEIGDDVVILSQGFDGSLGNLKFKVAGTIKTGSTDLDAMAAIISIGTAQELLALYGNRIHNIAVKLENFNDLEEVKNRLAAKVEDDKTTVLAWDEVMPDFQQSIELDNISGIMMLFILMIIIAFGILNTVLMSVTERFKEFGITLSIGMPTNKLVLLVLLETMFITSLGIIFGDIIGMGINHIIAANPIEFSGELAHIYKEYGFLPRIEASTDLKIILNISVSIIIISILAAIYPLVKVFRLEPLKGIRYT